MAYAVKYRITQASQTGLINTVDILEDSYAGSVISYDATSIQLEYIPSSDDPFEPIYASQLTVGINVTDNAANMPDFTALDDRKYLVKYYKNSVLKWQGWALSDNVQYLFSTGFKELLFNAVCGLGMLERIDYSTSSTNYRITLLQVFQDIFSKLEIPSQTILSSCSIYSSTMFNRIDNPNSEPWFQSYMAVNNFVKLQTNEQGETRNEFSCLEVLRDILLSWGCRVFHANGEWNIFQVNQQNEATRYFTRYSVATGYLNDGTLTTNVNVPNDAIFFDNSQLKIYKKGFNNFESFKQIIFPNNFLQNANLKQLTLGNADYWTTTTAGTGLVAVKENQDKGINAFILAQGDVGTGSLAQVDSQTPIPITLGDSPKVQFRVYNTTANLGGGGALLPNCLLRIIIAGAVVSYYLKEDNTWGSLLPGTTDFYRVNDKTNNTLVNLEEIPPAPESGTLSFGLLIQGSGINTQSAIIVGDFEVTFESEYKSVLLTAEINATETYRKTITFPHGYNVDNTAANTKIGFLGAVTDINGNQMYGWYMQERFGVDNYFSLAELMFQNYINMLQQNIINIDASVYGTFEATDVLTFTDTDPAQISVQGTKYLIGNGGFNSQRNEFRGTFLQIDNTHKAVTTSVIYDNGVGVGIEQSMSSTGATSSSAACAFTTYPLKKYSVQFLPVVGDVIYNDINLTQPFAGNTIWFKFFIVYFNTTRSFRINASGVITESATC
jgi:hypothetical protein